MRTRTRQRAWVLRIPVEQPSRIREEVLLWSEELGVNMWQSLSVSNSLLKHDQHQPFRNPFANKVWEVYFYKEVCSFVIWSRHYVSVNICKHMSIKHRCTLWFRPVHTVCLPLKLVNLELLHRKLFYGDFMLHQNDALPDYKLIP